MPGGRGGGLFNNNVKSGWRAKSSPKSAEILAHHGGAKKSPISWELKLVYPKNCGALKGVKISAARKRN